MSKATIQSQIASLIKTETYRCLFCLFSRASGDSRCVRFLDCGILYFLASLFLGFMAFYRSILVVDT